MIRHFLSKLAFLIPLFPGVCAAESLSLSDFLSQVRQANPATEAARARAQALEHRIGPSSTLDDPFVAAGVDQVPFNGSGGSVIRYQLSQTVPFPGKLSAKGDAAQGRAEAAFADAETSARTLAVLATQVFYRAFFNFRSIVLNEESRKYLQDTIESTKSRYKTGQEGHHDWLLGRIELGVLEAEKLRLERERKTLYAAINELRNEPADAPVTLGDPGLDHEKEVESEPAQLLAAQPELRASRMATESALAEERAAKLSYAPDFVLQGMAMQPRGMDMGGQPANWGVMAGINLPLYFWRKQTEQVNAAQADREAAEAEKKSLENRLRTEIVDATEQLKTARDVVALYRKDVIPLTEIAAKSARAGYAARRLPLTQLIDTLKVERTQQLELVAARIDVEVAKARLENLLSAPPIMKLAPSRPTVFGGAAMGTMTEGMSPGTSGTVNMGAGMSGPTRRESKSGSQGPGSPGMGNMQ